MYMGVSAYKCPEIMIFWGFGGTFAKAPQLNLRNTITTMVAKKVRALNVQNMVFSQNLGCLFFEDGCARNSFFWILRIFEILVIL